MVLAAACTRAPTLPLPPPSALVEAPDAEGRARVTGDGAVEGALISVLNERTGRGVLTTADDLGRFDTLIEAGTGDLLQVWQTVGTDSSAPTTVQVP